MYDETYDAQPFLRLEQLTLDLGGRRLVDISDLSLRQDGVTVVMGPNGAGKSLLLRLINGLQQPTSGEISSDRRSRIQAFVFQSPILLRRTAVANIRFVLKAKGKEMERTQELLERVDLGRRAKTPARQLSGGEQQRLAIAQALALEPEVLLLDEPTASLDPSATAMIENILVSVAKEGVRVVFVTHDAMQARRLADDVVFMVRGRVVEHMAAARFFENPETDEARAYLEGRLLS